MPRLIVKAAPDRDLYCEWSTVVDAPTFIGNREEILAFLRREGDSNQRPEDRLQRADDTGTSQFDRRGSGMGGRPWPHPPDGHWDDGGFIWDQRGWLPRARLAEALDWVLANDLSCEIPSSLLDPFEDDEDGAVRPAAWEKAS